MLKERSNHTPVTMKLLQNKGYLKNQEQVPAIVVRLKPKYIFCQRNLNIFLALISK